MPNILLIQEILKGYSVDRSNIQSVGNMTILPIVSDIEFTNVADTNEITFSKDVSYNSLQFKNSSGKIGIAIQGWAIMDNKQRAQDRTIPYAHLIKAANSKVIPANCIQHTQCGNFDASKFDQNTFAILPPSLRGAALKKSSFSNADVGALWETLRSWNKKVDCDREGLTSFYSKFESKLDLFVAQFEPVEKQLGSVVLINDQIVAIDIMPKYESWKKIWRALIRDSYGAEAIRVSENGNSIISRPKLESKKFKKIEDLKKYYDEQKTEFYDSLQSKFSGVAQLSVGLQKQEEVNELTLVKIENEQFIGQGVMHGDKHFIYLSLVSSSMQSKPIETFKSLRRNPYGESSFNFTN